MAGLLLHALSQALKLGVSLNGLLGEGVVEPPVDQRRHGGEAGGDELFELGALDGQHGLACGAQDLVDEGQSQHGGAGDGGSGDGAGGDDMCVHGVKSFLFRVRLLLNPRCGGLPPSSALPAQARAGQSCCAPALPGSALRALYP